MRFSLNEMVTSIIYNLSHHTPQAILLGLEGQSLVEHAHVQFSSFEIGSDPETIDCGTIPSRYEGIVENKTLMIGGKRRIHFDMEKDMIWRWDQVLKTHPNGMRFSVFDAESDLLATNEYFR